MRRIRFGASWHRDAGDDAPSLAAGSVPASYAERLMMAELKRQTTEPKGVRFMTVPQFLDAYAVTRSSFYRLVRNGDLPLTKCGRSSRVATDDAERWAASLPRIIGGANDA